MHLPSVICCDTHRALFTNKIVIRSVPNHYTLRCVHVCFQLIELQELAHSVVYCMGRRCLLPKKEMHTQILIGLFSAQHQTLAPHKVSDGGPFRLVRFASSTGRRR